MHTPSATRILSIAIVAIFAMATCAEGTSQTDTDHDHDEGGISDAVDVIPGEPTTDNNPTSHRYICYNGTPADGTTPNENTARCAECDDGYVKSGDECVTGYDYICTNGMAVDGLTSIANTVKCTSCDTRYLLQNDSCAPDLTTDAVGEDNVFKNIKSFSHTDAENLGFQAGVIRRDPSDVIKVGNLYYVYYTYSTSTTEYGSGYDATVYYATSSDEGRTWTEQGEIIERGVAGAWDDTSVFTPNILIARGKYYVFYTGIGGPNTNTEKTHLGLAKADSPGGPFAKLSVNSPLLSPVSDDSQFDSLRIDDAAFITRDTNGVEEYWLYYKGRQGGKFPSGTKMGLAIATNPEGPYVRYGGNPVIRSGHEVGVWPLGGGVGAYKTNTNNVPAGLWYAPDGINFSEQIRFGRDLNLRYNDLPHAIGIYSADRFTKSTNARGLSWGIDMVYYATVDNKSNIHNWPHLRRWEITE